MAFSLSEIFVISDVAGTCKSTGLSLRHYHSRNEIDILDENFVNISPVRASRTFDGV
jgi:hypothetical protein